MALAIGALAVLALLFGPRLWAQWIFRRYGGERGDIPGTGGELARHLLDRFALHAVSVESVSQADHYDPGQRAVRLNAAHHDGRSLTAVAVAAHEVGHALQHARGESWLALRSRLVRVARFAERFGAAALVALPLIGLLTRAPSSMALMLAVGVLSMVLSTLVHLVTLPVEWDASFGKALPILKAGRYIPEQDERAVQRILRAAALTYLSASLASLLHMGRWLALLRR